MQVASNTFDNQRIDSKLAMAQTTSKRLVFIDRSVEEGR
jgi:hypothetical protein